MLSLPPRSAPSRAASGTAARRPWRRSRRRSPRRKMLDQTVAGRSSTESRFRISRQVTSGPLPPPMELPDVAERRDLELSRAGRPRRGLGRSDRGSPAGAGPRDSDSSGCLHLHDVHRPDHDGQGQVVAIGRARPGRRLRPHRRVRLSRRAQGLFELLVPVGPGGVVQRRVDAGTVMVSPQLLASPPPVLRRRHRPPA
jgi:hypothetical protein